MDEKYYTIGELAKIKGVHIKSLRYYDKIGILKPAYVNLETGYRYYTAKQFFIVDDIQMCLELGMPLQSLKQCYNGDSGLDMTAFMEISRQAAEKKLKKVALGLAKIEKTLTAIKDNEAFQRQGLYERLVPERHILSLPCDSLDVVEQAARMTEIFELALRLDTEAVYPSGMIRYIQGGVEKNAVFIEVLADWLDHPSFCVLPRGYFLCHQGIGPQMAHWRDIVGQGVTEGQETLVVESDFLQRILRYDEYYSELQLWQRGE